MKIFQIIFKEKKLILLCVFIFLFNVYNVHAIEEKSKTLNTKYIKARVIETKSYENPQTVKVIILTGEYRDNTLILLNELILSNNEALILKEGDDIFISIEINEKGIITGGIIEEYARENSLIYLIGLFIFLLLIIGGFKGIRAIVALCVTGILIAKIFLPSILQGKNPTIYSIYVIIVIIIVTMFILNGFKKKTIIAIIGTAGGVLVSGIISIIFMEVAKLSGMSEETLILVRISPNINLDFNSLLFAGIVIGSLGAVMDISMSIASALHEIEESNPSIFSKDLMRAGMNIGKDTMGTMTNTLILAYVGSSLNTLLVYIGFNYSISTIINNQVITTEILRALAGSIGLIFSIPITVLAAVIFKNKTNSVSYKRYNY